MGNTFLTTNQLTMVETTKTAPLPASGEIIKSQSDKRAYKYITLKNQL